MVIVLQQASAHLRVHCRDMRILLCALLLAAGATSAMAQKKAVMPPGTPAGRPFSPGILTSDGTLYCAGQTGSDSKTGKIPDNFEEEVKNTLENVGKILKTAGYDFKDAVSVQVYLTDMDLFARMNTVYMTYFPEPRPVRTTVGVAKLVGTAKIEITVTAKK